MGAHQVGERVILVACSEERSFIGETGTIVRISENATHQNNLIRFDKPGIGWPGHEFGVGGYWWVEDKEIEPHTYDGFDID